MTDKSTDHKNQGFSQELNNMHLSFCTRIPFVSRTCSPYFIGPMPFIVYREKDPIVLGQPNSLP